MDNKLIENVRSKLPDSLGNLASKISPSNIGTVLTMLDANFRNSAASSTELATPFACVWDRFDGDVFKEKFDITQDSRKFFECDGHALSDTLTDVVRKYGLIETFGPFINVPMITITTSSGKVCKLFANGSNLASLDGYHAYGWPVVEAQNHYDPITGTLTPFDAVHYLVRGVSRTEDDEVWIPLVDVISDLMENGAISNALHQAVITIMNGGEVTAANLLNLANTVESKWDSVRSICTRIYQAWNVGGIYAVLRTIIEIVKGVSTVEVNSDGFLEFTSATGLVPQAYTAGILTVAGYAFSAIATAISAIFSPILAVAGSVITSLITNIVGSYKYNTSLEHASINQDNLKSVGGLAPFFGSRDKYQFTSEQMALIHEKVGWMQYDGVFLAPVPGGSLIAYLADDGRFSYEFHPDIVDRREWVYKSGLLKQKDVPVEVITPDWFKMAVIDWSMNVNVLVEGLSTGKVPVFSSSDCSVFDHWSDEVVLFNDFSGLNGSDNVLSESDSYDLGSITCCNLLLHFAWMISSIYPRYSMAYCPVDLIGQLYCYQSDGTSMKCPQYPMLSPFDLPTVRYLLGDILRLAIWAAWGAIPGYPGDSTMIANIIGDPYSICGKISSAFESLLPSDEPDDVSQGITYHLNSYAGDWASGFVLPIRLPINLILNPAAPSHIITPGLTGTPITLSSDLTFYYTAPKYKPGTVLLGTITAGIITTLSVSVVAVASVLGAKAIKKARAVNAAKAESAWSNLTANPTKENYQAYAKAVRRNNAFVKIFGGSTLSKSGYWDSDSSGGVVGSVASKVGEQINSASTDEMSSTESGDASSQIIRLLRGSIPEPSGDSD